ncbi:DUF4138 domain-containing protein [Aggregatimonas sangjinii]|uniref:DUF4138 domain-containing protein n=1 Tax=Aggregatimonas sangjinii TaxID=2583587 RepID=A0A5B7STE0_9FLAO|nr:DUF4138 domain-containing protein [Aggregatimonas sangjinii]QCX00599.1 DUF4138 domain-containing protein [Aggregatimonas sangjinii]
MKRYLLTSIITCVFVFSNAQESIILDTIYANDQKNVALFFPEPIRQGITGSDNFVFTYNRDKEQYFGLLQAKPGKESNLLVINRNGAIFSYIVRYKEQLSKLNYFVPSASSIGNEKSVSVVPTVSKEEKSFDKSDYYLSACKYLVNRKLNSINLRERYQGIVLSIEHIVFDAEELYFVIQIKNTSTLDYNLNFLDLSVQTRQKGKKKSLQRSYQKPLFVHNRPTRIAENETVRMVYVLPKFSLSNDRRAVLELNEANGERNLKLKVSHRYINNPK